MLTVVEVNHSALLAELSVDSRERAGYNSWSSICAAVGSLTSLVGHLFWKTEPDLASFRVFALGVALGSWACFALAARYLQRANIGKSHDGSGKGGPKLFAPTEHTNPSSSSGAPQAMAARQREAHSREKEGSVSIEPRNTTSTTTTTQIEARKSQNSGGLTKFLEFLQQLRRQQNFVLFAMLASLQTFDCAFGKQFFTFFLELLVGDALSPRVHAIVITASFLLPWLGAAALSRGIERHGVSLSTTLRGLWIARLVLLFSAVFLVGSASSVMASASSITSSFWDLVWFRRGAALVVLLNRVISECVCRLMPLLESDLIDEFRFLALRPEKVIGPVADSESSMSATIVGTANFISKPSQSLGPIVGFAVINWALPKFDGTEQQVPEASPYGMGGSTLAFSTPATSAERGKVALLVLLLPLICVCLQLRLWRRFSLKGHYLSEIKRLLSAHNEGSAV
jgi:Na+/melibiose symporter-like transporter